MGILDLKGAFSSEAQPRPLTSLAARSVPDYLSAVVEYLRWHETRKSQ